MSPNVDFRAYKPDVASTLCSNFSYWTALSESLSVTLIKEPLPHAGVFCSYSTWGFLITHMRGDGADSLLPL